MRQIKFQITGGFSLIEIILVLGILGTLLGLVSMTFLNSREKVSLNANLLTIEADIRTQQIRSMVGDTHGDASSDSYGIHFDQDQYVLYYGTYTPNAPSNFEIVLEEGNEFTNITFPSSNLIFEKVSGIVTGFTPGANTATIRNTRSGEQQTITVNRYGVITSIN